jgi:hypothetical protein
MPPASTTPASSACSSKRTSGQTTRTPYDQDIHKMSVASPLSLSSRPFPRSILSAGGCQASRGRAPYPDRRAAITGATAGHNIAQNG